MNGDTIFGLTFIISFMLGVLLVGAAECVVFKIQAHRQRVKRLEKENESLKRVSSLLLLEIQTKELHKNG